MSQSIRPRHRRAAGGLQSQTPPLDGADLPQNTPLRRDAPDGRDLLESILNTPCLEQVVPRLQPELLYRVIQRCGLEDCGELLALTTPDQLVRILDLDLWRAAQPGLDEQFDANRFGLWVEVLTECGSKVAARKLVEMDVDLVIAGLAQHALVYDIGVVAAYTTTDGEQAAEILSVDDNLSCEVGGYLLVAKRADSWGPIIELLISLDAEHPEYFRQVMCGCRLLSNSGFELDGLHDLFADRDQVMFDLALHREGRRQKQGYLPPAQARAFLQMSRKLQLESDAMPPPNQIATAYFKGLGETKAGDPTSLDPLPAGSDTPSGPAAEAFSAVVDVLVEAGILTPPRALLSGSKLRETRLGLIQSLMQFLLDRDPASYSRRNEELTYLANSLMAGCSCQARPFTAQQASDAAIAVCNLGLENWPLHWLAAQATVLPDDFLVCHDLVTVFQIGWTILYDKVVLYAAKQLIESLTALRCDDREIQRGLDALRIKMTRHWKTGEPWRARSALEVIAILDMPAWASLLGLIDECPVIHAGMGAAQGLSKHSISPSAFDFISENRQIASVRDFMQSLPEILSR